MRLGVRVSRSGPQIKKGKNVALEIERKWLVDGTKGLKETLEKDVVSYKRITQGYLVNAKSYSVRVRTSNYIHIYPHGTGSICSYGHITVKRSVGDSLTKREEYEYSIPFKDANELLSDLEEKILKDRYVVGFGVGLNLEIDFFKGKLDGLVVAEVEFPNEESSEKPLDLPDWLPVIREVTDDPRFLNCNLIGKTYEQLSE